jgi:hypothetical protein
MAVTVDNVTVIITDYKPKKKESKRDHSPPESPPPNDDVKAERDSPAHSPALKTMDGNTVQDT